MRYLVLACLAAAASGCATESTSSSAAAPSASSRDGSYRTGSRLPSYDPPGTAASREVSRDDWIDERRSGGNHSGR